MRSARRFLVAVGGQRSTVGTTWVPAGRGYRFGYQTNQITYHRAMFAQRNRAILCGSGRIQGPLKPKVVGSIPTRPIRRIAWKSVTSGLTFEGWLCGAGVAANEESKDGDG